MIKVNSTKVHILSTAYWGPCSYYSLLLHSNFQIEIHENYQKKSIRNRCLILGAQGLQTLSVPLQKGKNNKSSIAAVPISYEMNWIKQHVNALKVNYQNAPFYAHYIDEIHRLYEPNPTNLLQLNRQIFDWVNQRFQLNINLLETTKFDPLAHRFSDKYFLERKENSTLYPQIFEEKFGFISNLSILDLIFNIGPELKFYLPK